MVGCSVFGCKNNSSTKIAGVSFHTFPKEENIKKLWIERTGNPNWLPHKYSRMCSKHFEEHCFRRTFNQTFLEQFSIPTLFIHEIPTESMDVQTQTDMPASHHGVCDYVIIKSEIPAETNDVETQTETPAPHHNATEKSLKPEPIMTPKEGQLLLKLNRQKTVSEERHKKIAALRSKNRRLEKKNADLIAIIQELGGAACTKTTRLY